MRSREKQHAQLKSAATQTGNQKRLRQANRCTRALRLSIFILLCGPAQADSPELFQADPWLQDDYIDSLPTHGTTRGLNYEIVQGQAIFEGDILLGQVNQSGAIADHIQKRGLGKTNALGRWPDGIVPYVVPSNSSELQKLNIMLAIDHWVDSTRISFIERTSENAAQYPNYVRFTSSNSCASYVGMQGGEQVVFVSDGCSFGSIIHEIGHTLGLFHEHTRSDRENYVQIDWNQIVEGKDINFYLQDIGTENFGPYDYGSIMHYGENFFSGTGQPTIIVPDGVEIGQRQALSQTDIDAINGMYATDLALLSPAETLTNEGLELDVTVLNQGELGASELVLEVTLDEDSNWQGVSTDTDWNCMYLGAELQCTLSALKERTESRFSLMANPGSSSNYTVHMTLSARTLDLSTGNDSHNLSKTDDAITADTPENDSGLVSPPPDNSLPAVGAATQTNKQTSSQDDAVAGSDNGSLLIMVVGLLSWRRYRMTPNVQ